MESTSFINVNQHPIFGNKDLFREILKNFNVFEILRLSSVCQAWQEAAHDFELLKQMNMPFWARVKLNPTPKKTTIALDELGCIFALYKDRIIVGNKVGTLRIFTKEGKLQLKKEGAHEGKIHALKIAEGKCLSASKKAIKVWNLEEENPFNKTLAFFKPDEKESEIVEEIVFNGRYIAANLKYFEDPTTYSYRMKIWDIELLTFEESLDTIFNKITFYEKFGFFIDSNVLNVFAYDLEKSLIALRHKLDLLCYPNLFSRVYQNKLCILEGKEGSASKMHLYSLPELEPLQENQLPKLTSWATCKRYIRTLENTACTLLCFKENGEFQIAEMIHLPEKFEIKMDGSSTLIYAGAAVFIASSSFVDFAIYKGLIFLTYFSGSLKQLKISGTCLYFCQRDTLTILDYSAKGENSWKA